MKKRNLKILVSATMIFVTALSSTAAVITLKKHSEYAGKEVTFDDTTKSIVLTTKEELTEKYSETILATTDLFKEEIDVETKIEYPIDNNEESNVFEENNMDEDYLYQKLRKNFEEVLIRKNFSKEVNEILNGSFELLNANYDSSYKVYKSLNILSKEEYIQTFINNIDKNIDSIELVDETDPKYSDYHKELKIARGMYIASSNTILLNNKFDLDVLEVTALHEVTHSEQEEKIVHDRYNIDLGMYKILTEGECANTSRYLSSTVRFNNNRRCEEGSMECYFIAPDSSKNAYYARYYNMLCVMAGFDTMRDCKANGYNEKELIEKIESKYNINAKKFLDKMKYCAANIATDPSSTIEKACSVEKEFVKCLKKIVVNANTKEEVFDALQIYRDYKIQYAFSCYDNDVNITDKMLGLSKIENILFDKVCENKLLPDGIEKGVFDVLMLNAGEGLNSGEERSADDVLYFVVDDEIVFTSKHTKEAKLYNQNNNTLFFYESNNEIYNSSKSAITSGISKTI